jgi:sugar lactone lactonase YvrE
MIHHVVTRRKEERFMIEAIAEFGNLCGECPVWDPAGATLYWTDCTGQKFFRYRDGKPELVCDGFEITGFRLNDGGGYTVANTRGIWTWDGLADPVLICSEVEGHPCQMNDCTADPTGRFIGGTNFYDPQKEYPRGKLIRIDIDGKAAVLDEGFHLSNGLAFSPDQRTLYFADSVGRLIYAYDYSVETGSVANRRVLVEVPATEGLPDGLSVDAEGFVWAAHWYGGRIVRYDPDGRVERRIEVPAKQASSLTFGGPDLTDIFITSAARSEPMPVQPPGYDAASGFFGGPLFHTNVGIPGLPAFRTRFKVPGAMQP